MRHEERGYQPRAAQPRGDEPVGAISGAMWVRYIPVFLLRTFIRTMSRNVRWAKRYGVVGVSNVGMFGDGAGWGVAPSAATVDDLCRICTRCSAADRFT